MTQEWNNELALATEAAIAAGQILMRFFKADLTVDKKSGGEPVTEADRQSEQVVIERLRAAFPGYGLLSEEQPDQQSWLEHRRIWLVDPMDGTRDFVAGREGFSVMIGLLEDFRPVLGVVHQPLRGVVYRAARGGSAEMLRDGSTTVLRTTNIAEPERARLVSSYSHRSGRMDRIKEQLGITDEQSYGSVGLKVAAIARGERDLYLNPEGHCKLWDTCAPEAILTVAGGKMTDMRGRPLIYNDPDRIRLDQGVVASNGACHEAVLQRLAPFVEAD